MKDTRVDPKHRILVLFAFMFLAFLVVGVRMWYLQVWRGDHYDRKARETRRTKEIIEAPRGKIIDRNGTVLAEDIVTFDVYADRSVEKLATGFNNLLSLLRKHGKADPKLPVPEPASEEWQEWEDYKKEKEKNPLRLVAHSVGYDIAEQIAVRQRDFPGIIVKIGSKRYYRAGELACQVVGYVGPMREGEKEEKLSIGYFLSDNLGRFGVEKKCEDDLRGRRGGRVVERNYKSGTAEVLLETQSHAGSGIQLTLDLKLQAAAERELDKTLSSITGKKVDRGASAVMMDVNTGAILIMASRPGYDPSAFAPPRDNRGVLSALNDNRKPLLNRVIQGCYPLGSIFKVVTITAGLETEKIGKNTTFDCDGVHELGGRSFRCWRRPPGHGTLIPEQAIQRSCNVFMYRTAERTGAKHIAAWARSFGYGAKTGIDLPYEKSGIVPDPGKRERPWSGGDTLNLSIGQGDLTVTPLQVARCIAAIANGGYLVSPRMLEETSIIREKIDIKKDTLDLVRKGMWMVVNSPWGTGLAACQKRVDVAGKTSTAEVSGMPDHAWFACFGPYENTEICLIVMVEYGGKGGAVAAPIAGAILKEYFKGRLPKRNSAPIG